MKTLLLLTVCVLTFMGCTTARYDMLTITENGNDCLIKFDKATGKTWRLCPGSTWGQLADTE